MLQTLKQLQREQHEARVAALVARNRVFYRRQRCCESFTAFVIEIPSIVTPAAPLVGINHWAPDTPFPRVRVIRVCRYRAILV